MTHLETQARTNSDGITFEPFAMDGMIGFRITEPAPSKRVEYLLLAPSGWHDYNPDNEATADTFVMRIAGNDAKALDADLRDNGSAILADFARPITYVNHFGRE